VPLYGVKLVLSNDNLVLALPKGRILEEIMPLIKRAGIEPEAAFNDTSSRRLRFSTNHANLDIVRVRSFDVATFIIFGAAHLGRKLPYDSCGAD
jgi:ATP phosphoribosyltransferase